MIIIRFVITVDDKLVAFVLVVFTTIDNRAVIIQFTFDNRLPFGCLVVFTLQDMKGFIVFHIIDKALGGCQCQCTTVSGGIIHIGHNTDIIHQGSYVLCLFSSILPGRIGRRHVIPLVRSIEGSRKGEVVSLGSIRMAALTHVRPFMILHGNRCRGGDTSGRCALAVYHGTQIVIRCHLIP